MEVILGQIKLPFYVATLSLGRDTYCHVVGALERGHAPHYGRGSSKGGCTFHLQLVGSLKGDHILHSQQIGAFKGGSTHHQQSWGSLRGHTITHQFVALRREAVYSYNNLWQLGGSLYPLLQIMGDKKRRPNLLLLIVGV